MGPQTKRLRNMPIQKSRGYNWEKLQWGRKQNACGMPLCLCLCIVTHYSFNGAANKTLAELYCVVIYRPDNYLLQWGRKQNACGIRTLESFTTGLNRASMGPQTKRLRNHIRYAPRDCGLVLQWGRKQNACGIVQFGFDSRHVHLSFNGAANKTLAE